MPWVDSIFTICSTAPADTSEVVQSKTRRYVLLGISALWLLLLAIAFGSFGDVRISGLTSVKQGMTRNEVTALLGIPRRQNSTLMKIGIYGVPSRMFDKVGFGNPFEMWEYEKAIPRKTAYATVWFCPDSNQEMRVIDVTTQTVRRSLKFRVLNWIGEKFPWTGVND
jgi:hypothetical protein